MFEARWLLLLHHIPPKPAYFRAKVLRRLSQVGALAVKNSAYLLPATEDTLEDFEWLSQEITQQGGAAWLFRAEMIDGMSQEQIEDSFRQLHEPELQDLVQQTRALLEQAPHYSEDAISSYRKLVRRHQELKRIDFFGCRSCSELEELLGRIEKQTKESRSAPTGLGERAQVWVTRKGVKVDRIASAWLIRRFIDTDAMFRFVDSESYVHSPGEIRFDMFQGEYTHQGDLCTFEVLLEEGNLESDAALVAIAEMVHDIDLKEDRYQRPETSGFARMLEGLCAQTPVDEQRLERGGMLLDSLYQSFR